MTSRRIRRFLLPPALLALVLASACRDQPGHGPGAGPRHGPGADQGTNQGHDPDDGHGHAPGEGHDSPDSATARAVSNSEGLCPEHGVLSSVCTICNPSLAPIFQAKGDWCPEHSLPESFCPICSPAAGGRPVTTADLSSSEPPADGLVIRLKGPDAESRAAFATYRAEAAPSEEVVTAVARIEAGPRHRADVSARTEAVVARLLVDAGDAVRRGQSMATLEGPAGETASAQVSAASARAVAARAAASREQSLREKGISTGRDVLAAEQELAAAEGELATARAQLSLVGGASQRLVSPLDGVVTRRVATIGQLVHPGDVLFEVADLSGVDAVADVREELLAGISPGREAEVLVPAVSASPLPGEVESVAPIVDPLTRTGQVRVHVDNPLGLLRPGMTAEARLRTRGREDAVLVPREAIQQARGAQLAFVRTAPGVFETRRVRLGASRGENIEVLEGLRAGEEVVTTGSFLLKTETLPGSIGTGCCEIEGMNQ